MITRHGHPALLTSAASTAPNANRQRFSKMFPELPGLAGDHEKLRQAMAEIGRPGGPMDGSLLETGEGANFSILAGFTFLGQFIDHDVTFDSTSSLDRRNRPDSTTNLRTPALDLDSLYGGGPNASPHLYDRHRFGRFLIESRSPVRPPEECQDPDLFVDSLLDLPRNSQDTALIADPRNDENVIAAQIHLLFLRFHNRVLDQLSGDPQTAFEEARRIVRWHYQWIVLHEYLPKICDAALIGEILASDHPLGDWKVESGLPVEFTVAAFRFGHSQVRSNYQINDRNNQDPPIFGQPNDPCPDLSGGKPLNSSTLIDWQFFFELPNEVPSAEPGRKIDTNISAPLLDLAFLPGGPRSLATRNLLRGLAFELPSGQRVAEELGETPLGPEDFEDLTSDVLQELGPDLNRETPLWFYVLREADRLSDGEKLGPVGARIVAGVLIRLLEKDPSSFLNVEPDWQPDFLADGDGSEIGRLIANVVE